VNLIEANKKLCPIHFVPCRTKHCMMWRWNHKIRKVNVSERVDGQIWIDQDEGLSNDDGYCGLGGKE